MKQKIRKTPAFQLVCSYWLAGKKQLENCYQLGSLITLISDWPFYFQNSDLILKSCVNLILKGDIVSPYDHASSTGKEQPWEDKMWCKDRTGFDNNFFRVLRVTQVQIIFKFETIKYIIKGSLLALES